MMMELLINGGASNAQLLQLSLLHELVRGRPRHFETVEFLTLHLEFSKLNMQEICKPQ